MQFLFAVLLGEGLLRIGFFRAAAAALVIGGASFVGYQLMARNVDPGSAWLVAIGVPLALVAWALWNPTISRFGLWLAEGTYLIVRLGMWLAVAMVAMMLLQSGFHLPLWFQRAWPWAVLGAVLWVCQRVLDVQVRRVRRMAEPSNEQEVLA